MGVQAAISQWGKLVAQQTAPSPHHSAPARAPSPHHLQNGVCTASNIYSEFIPTPIAATLNNMFPALYCGEKYYNFRMGDDKHIMPYLSLSRGSIQSPDYHSNTKVGMIVMHGTDWTTANNYICAGANNLMLPVMAAAGWNDTLLRTTKLGTSADPREASNCCGDSTCYYGNEATNPDRRLFEMRHINTTDHCYAVRRSCSGFTGGGTRVFEFTFSDAYTDQVFFATPEFITPLPDDPENTQPWIPPYVSDSTTISWIGDSVHVLNDYIQENMLFWDYCQGNRTCQWSFGAASTATYQTQWSAFSIIDLMIESMLNTTNFPAMEKIILVGHGGGGDVIMRQALFSTYAQSV